MYDAVTNPPAPEWNSLSDEERTALVKAWEYSSCPHACGGDPIHFYETLRQVLRKREKRVLAATMLGDGDEYHRWCQEHGVRP